MNKSTSKETNCCKLFKAQEKGNKMISFEVVVFGCSVIMIMSKQ